MHKHPQHNGKSPPLPNCGNCTHSIRIKERHDALICVPHLKTMPCANAAVCDLYSTKGKKH